MGRGATIVLLFIAIFSLVLSLLVITLVHPHLKDRLSDALWRMRLLMILALFSGVLFPFLDTARNSSRNTFHPDLWFLGGFSILVVVEYLSFARLALLCSMASRDEAIRGLLVITRFFNS